MKKINNLTDADKERRRQIQKVFDEINEIGKSKDEQQKKE